ncbi:MogA/MoaB family molybdenum cofactor biosynthesis protein [Peribacillus psychrosaccharolyticus]|uniref:Molybdenum cofactor biosynthesis protein B n=1 Tax=Peribacillus psychrosaccharolyticus TaxID=1407 RepID=A0A974NKP2_PERPY|nr:MogA/MoaB family molybdenum cofactor biosynthesis protein [Peribacillus psychrosaccharolyticus]MEC2054716.1 MogA/MoaB family molybdenum cofactor biosynthesis protein [Peribacillus psychrosaccharolyticus]MED3744057.1 MogA/MoaB family molybdenum cofactor biosynthesis protein [Peribacillus psychrosaccharolyticus]QQS99552.1 MogA/MoaB family molybdenum cofactor biosynthesis protein [Peribacillus psychrosaccharolyticus]
MGLKEHKETTVSVRCKIITVSDTRNVETDKSGMLMNTLIHDYGHQVTAYQIVKDNQEDITTAIQTGLNQTEVDVVLLNGGTGIAKRDVTIETVNKLFDKEIPGFGELFRMLSYQEDIGSAAILSRATAGTANNKAIFATPGSSGAVRLAMEKLILPEIGHIVKELKKDL